MTINELVESAHAYAVRQGFWPANRNLKSSPLFILKGVSEALEVLRQPGYCGNIGEELADIMIRVADLAGHLSLDLDHAIQEKMDYNNTRPFKHGKRF